MTKEITPKMEKKFRQIVREELKKDGEMLYCSYGQPSSFWASPKKWVFVPRHLVGQYRGEHEASTAPDVG